MMHTVNFFIQFRTPDTQGRFFHRFPLFTSNCQIAQLFLLEGGGVITRCCIMIGCTSSESFFISCSCDLDLLSPSSPSLKGQQFLFSKNVLQIKSFLSEKFFLEFLFLQHLVGLQSRGSPALSLIKKTS